MHEGRSTIGAQREKVDSELGGSVRAGGIHVTRAKGIVPFAKKETQKGDNTKKKKRERKNESPNEECIRVVRRRLGRGGSPSASKAKTPSLKTDVPREVSMRWNRGQ